ncbi:hypothetical protein LCGC14_3138190 [marine sediment metagenome]|uniref:DUF4389 domain-containing protein n=1 Tax=marine sediment metagenome TaxID=412755 RepID=A0A0F8WLL6_9ZZZZ
MYDETTAAAAPGYPLRYDVEYPEELSRWLIFVKWLLVIPHVVILYALSIAAGVIGFIAFFAILFTKRYPRGLFDFVVNVNRWNANVMAYEMLFRDEYPPFSWEPGEYAVTYEVDYPEELNRWLPLIKWLLAIPHIIVLLFLFIAVYFVFIIAFFAILFTKRFPRGLFDFTVGVHRWNYRVSVYTNLQRDEYPPFSLR